MTSDNKTVMKAIDLLIMKREKLRDKKQNLRDKIDDIRIIVFMPHYF